MQFAERFGPWAVVTGASSGLGREFARALAARGVNPFLVARRGERLDELAAELQSGTPAECRFLECDLATGDAAATVLAATTGLEVGLLVNNAGFGYCGPFLDQESERIQAMAQLNCLAVASLARAFLPPMASRGRGGMVAVASTAAFQATPWMSLYGATKAFVLHLAEGLGEELRGTGVEVLALCPGHTATEFHGVAGVEGAVAGRAADARQVAEQALDSLGRRRRLVTGLHNRAMVLGSGLAPRGLALRAAGRLLGRRRRRPPT